MIVDFSLGTLIIREGISQLKPNQASQLNFWGFRKIIDKESYILQSENIESVLTKIIKYFDREQIPYTLTPTSQELLEVVNQELHQLQERKELGKKIREGNVHKKTFQEFVSFIQRQIPRPLKSHQIESAFHLLNVGNGANFSVPGSGKTAVVLTVYTKLKLDNEVNTLFIVGPPACFVPWIREFKLTLGYSPDYKILAGGDQQHRKSEYYTLAESKSELYLTTFQSLSNDLEDVRMFLGQQGIKAFLVIDEAHYIKQLGGDWATTVLRIAPHAIRRCVLTGTPLPRSYTDAYNQFDFLWPKHSPLSREAKTRIQMLESGGDINLAREELKIAIDGLFYRVPKSALNLQPPVFHPPVILKMNKYERLVYDAIENRIRNYAEKDYLKNIELVSRLVRGRMIRLRQCVSYTKLLSTSLEDYNESLVDEESDIGWIIANYDSLEIPSKLKYLNELVGKLNVKGKKVVIWSNFIRTIELIVEYLRENGFHCKLIYGQTPTEYTSVEEEETREQIRDEFLELHSGLDILVANPAACGESISLHKTCFHAIYYDLSYNCAQYLQSLDRIHRVGGSEKRRAHYHFLQYENTIDADIKQNLDFKASKMYEVIEQDYNMFSLEMFGDDDDTQAYERLFR